MSRLRRRVVVHGRVQGVAFRAATVAAARSADVAGWVRNRSDGSVEAVFEGTDEGMDRMLDFCGHGPRFARVERLEVFDESPEGLEGFGVR